MWHTTVLLKLYTEIKHRTLIPNLYFTLPHTLTITMEEVKVCRHDLLNDFLLQNVTLLLDNLYGTLELCYI
jgi:hypothetical protein